MPTPLSANASILDNVKSLDLLSRNLAKGILIGKHHSDRLASGLEFSQYRAYCQGDDLRLLDWKMYARTGKYFIRQAKIETENRVHVHIDGSASMDYMEDGMSKLQLSKILASTITYLAAKQGDNFSWDCHSLPMTTGRNLKDWRLTLIELYDLKSSTEETERTYNSSILNGIHIWITDLYMEREIIEQKIKSYTSKKSELIVLHIIGQKEENLDFRSDCSFIDLETNKEIEVDAVKFASNYKQALGEHIHLAYRLCTQNKAFYQKIYLQDDLPDIIRRFVKQYNSIGAI